MRLVALLAACLMFAIASSPVAAKRPPYVYGPEPGWEKFKELAEPAIRAKLEEPEIRKRLLDPANWVIKWPNGYAQWDWWHKGRFDGYLTCGVLLAKVPPAKGRAFVNFAVVIDYNQVKTVDISTRESNSLVNVACADHVARGLLPPARMFEAPRTEQAMAPSIGIDVRAMPEGGYVTRVAPGSPAERAGLTSGMVITHANGIALAGLGEAIGNILASDTPSLKLQTVGGQTFELKRAP